MQYAEMIAVYSDICPEHRYVLCGQNIEYLMVTTGDT
jgi:hypothetical protein